MVKKITKWLYLEPLIFKKEGLHLAEISKKLKINHTVVRQYLNYFENKGIIKKQKKGRLSIYKFNKENDFIIDIITIIEKEKLINRDLIIKEITGFIHKKLQNEKILIFGSASENIKKAGDLDLLIIRNKNKQTENKIKKTIKELENKINKKIHLLIVNKFSEISETLKEEIRKKHLIIQGSEEIIRWLI